MDTIKLDNADKVVVAARDFHAGDQVEVAGMDQPLTVRDDVPRGHKIAVRDIAAGEQIVKYGYPIGHAKADIPAGSWVHTHNCKSNLGPDLSYSYEPVAGVVTPGCDVDGGVSTRTFQGYRRKTGKVGVRNDLYIVPTVGCINSLCDNIVSRFKQRHPGNGSFDSIVIAHHPYGCSQLGGDHEMTKRLLQDITAHANAGGVLVVGLGCENNQIDEFRSGLSCCGEESENPWEGVDDIREGLVYDPERVKFMVCQNEDDEYATAEALLDQLDEAAKGDHREPVPLNELTIGVKCGGSDGLSGVTANPLVGKFAEFLVGQGGKVVLTEVPEMFGAEQVLMSHAKDEATFDSIVSLINNFKDYFRRHHQPIGENPSPGNKKGGITTLEDKSLGCIRKGGKCQVTDVIAYGHYATKPGLTLLQSPGNDLVSSSALASAGCNMVLFTTGRGTPFGTYVPTFKVATNSPLAGKHSHWIDFNAGRLLEEPMDDVLPDFIDKVLGAVDGEQTRNEQYGMHEIAIFKDGITE
ncbi:altronate dehydratase family protein [Bifidobacterium sp. ESL0763]|uniref:UxaA family hydrolase n=1 Tax=Bifidobacterium sp. ESL0763 TaxID=2983227 RepID=UPI0023F6AB4A|nr:altronate dehydratase family protein [Bifidobacterium sp. ESL0763]MDF7663358.1 altronate dehydratase family protein [Bifidobacterium sp. ESL0763]